MIRTRAAGFKIISGDNYTTWPFLIFFHSTWLLSTLLNSLSLSLSLSLSGSLWISLTLLDSPRIFLTHLDSHWLFFTLLDSPRFSLTLNSQTSLTFLDSPRLSLTLFNYSWQSLTIIDSPWVLLTLLKSQTLFDCSPFSSFQHSHRWTPYGPNHLPSSAHSGKPSTQFFIEILQTHFQSPQMHHPLPTLPWFFQRQNWTHPHQIFTIWFSWSVSFSTCPTSKADQFIPATLTEIHKLISTSESKQCPLDSIPNFPFETLLQWTWSNHLKSCQSLSFWRNFPSSFKQAFVQPLLKKPSLSTDDLNNFRPNSNLNFISKILEKVVASRIQSYLSSNSLSPSFQSAYQIFRSTETTLLKIHNDLILAMDRGKVTSLILLDLSAAFDTVDHSILLTRLQNWLVLMVFRLIGSHLISHLALMQSHQWFHLCILYSPVVYPKFRTCPLLSTLYTTPLGSVISNNSIKYHFVRWWHSQLYISFSPTNSALSLETLTNTFTDILFWMNLNKLLLNPSETLHCMVSFIYNLHKPNWKRPASLHEISSKLQISVIRHPAHNPQITKPRTPPTDRRLGYVLQYYPWQQLLEPANLFHT